MSFKLPTHDSTTEMLGMIFGEDTEVFDGTPVDPASSYIATFVDDQGTLVAFGACDVPFSAYAGSALSLIPKAGAQDAVNAGAPTGPMVENLYEVMNICTRLLMDEKTSHLKMDKLLPPGEGPAEELARIAASGQAAHMKVDVPRYGMGCVSFYIG